MGHVDVRGEVTGAPPTRVPEVRGRFPGDIPIQLQRHRIEFMERLFRECGDVAHFRVGKEKMYLLSHPDHVRDVLVTHQKLFKKGRALERAKILLGEGLLTSEGEQHLRQRRMMQPAFHRQRIAGYGDTMIAYTARRTARWRDGQTFDLHEEMMALTLAIVGKTLFDADVERDARDIGEALTDALAAFNIALYIPWLELAERLPLPVMRRFRRGRARMEETIRRMVAEHRASGADHGDLLSMLLAARDDEGDGRGMSDTQLRDEALTLFLAGHETTANALSWTFYLLARHSDVEARLHAELDALGTAPLGPDTMASLPYTRLVLTESMRLYPPAWIIGRRALTAYPVGEYTLPAGAVVLVSEWIIQRDARWFPEPERFDPDRWLPERAATRPKFSYFPFGGGSRICIGEQFAWMEGVLLLAAIAREWRLRLVSPRPVTPNPIFTLRPRGGIPMRAERRRPAAR